MTDDCAKFYHCRICVTYVRKGGLFALPHPWAAPKRPILNRVKANPGKWCFPLSSTTPTDVSIDNASITTSPK